MLPGPAQLGERGPQVGRRRRSEERRARDALAVGNDDEGDGVDRVAVVQRAVGAVLDLAGRDVGGIEDRGLGRHDGAPVAGRRREDDDEPGRVGAGEVGAMQLPGHLARHADRVGRLLLPQSPRDHAGDEHEHGRDDQACSHGTTELRASG